MHLCGVFMVDCPKTRVHGQATMLIQSITLLKLKGDYTQED